jgi:hypothetical protein
MGARHHVSGKFAALGRQPRTEHAPVKQFREGRSPIHKKQARMDNAAFNASATRQGGPAQGATPGQVVATVKVS